jgi:single-strand DNA-binding protein
LPPSPALPGSGCPQLHRPAATGRRRCPFITARLHGASWRTPEIRYTREGQATTQLGVAVNRRWLDKATQEWQEATSFFDVVCWRDLAENVALSLSKGMRVVVSGRIEQRSWETDDGEHRSKVEIVADEIGPSLRFATADVRRTERRQGAEGFPESSDDEVASI